MKIGEVMNNVDPEVRSVFRAMLVKAGINEDTPMGNITKILTLNGHTKEEMLAYVTVVGMGQRMLTGKFAPKMSFDQRCELLALYRKGYTREALAKLYGVDRRTVTHIHNAQSSHYRNVREEELRLGRENFLEKYITADSMAKVMELAAVESEVNNKQAKGKQGIHTVQGPMCKYPHRVRIEWKEANDKDILTSGWYYNDMDSDFPDGWFHTGPESMKTSQACYEGMLEDITDRLS